MLESKKLMTRALELATTVLGRKHHFVASIYLKVWIIIILKALYFTTHEVKHICLLSQYSLAL